MLLKMDSRRTQAAPELPLQIVQNCAVCHKRYGGHGDHWSSLLRLPRTAANQCAGTAVTSSVTAESVSSKIRMVGMSCTSRPKMTVRIAPAEDQ